MLRTRFTELVGCEAPIQLLDTVIAKAPGPVGINFLMPFVDRAALDAG